MVDLRDGALAYANNSLPINMQNMEGSEFTMQVDPAKSLVLLSVGATRVGLSVTDMEKPPQPVCYYGAMNVKKQTGTPFTLPR